MNRRTSGQEFIRRVNENIYDVLVRLECEDGEFWCECADPRCEERVVRTLREFAALGETPLVSPTHAANLQRA